MASLIMIFKNEGNAATALSGTSREMAPIDSLSMLRSLGTTSTSIERPDSRAASSLKICIDRLAGGAAGLVRTSAPEGASDGRRSGYDEADQ
jgi:hypothetical protein